MNVKNKQNGFTLPEVLIAAGLMAVVMAAVYSVFWSGMKAGARASSDTHIAARETLDLMGREIRSICFRPGVEEFKLSGEIPAGDNSRISFCTVRETAHGEARPVLVEYYLADHPSTGKSVLYRRNTAVFDNPDFVESTQAVAPHIDRFETSYFHEGSWKESWSDPEKLPEKIRLRIGMAAGGGEPDWFETEITLPGPEREE